MIDASFDTTIIHADGTITVRPPTPDELAICLAARRARALRAQSRTRSLAPVVPIRRARAHNQRSRAPKRPGRRAGSSTRKATADPDPEGDPDAVPPHVRRFLHWLADEAIKEMVEEMIG
jgi:hypothetical protein